MLFRGIGTSSFAKKTSREKKNEKQSPSRKEFLGQSQSSTPERETKMVETIPFMA